MFWRVVGFGVGTELLLDQLQDSPVVGGQRCGDIKPDFPNERLVFSPESNCECERMKQQMGCT